MLLCCCCSKKTKGKVDDDTDGSEPLLKSADSEDESLGESNPKKLGRSLTIGEIEIDVSETSLSIMGDGVPELGVERSNSIGNTAISEELLSGEKSLGDIGYIHELPATQKTTKPKKKVSFGDEAQE